MWMHRIACIKLLGSVDCGNGYFIQMSLLYKAETSLVQAQLHYQFGWMM